MRVHCCPRWLGCNMHGACRSSARRKPSVSCVWANSVSEHCGITGTGCLPQGSKPKDRALLPYP
eukprot:2773258-Alexandrium_andersonii.AAC.1